MKEIKKESYKVIGITKVLVPSAEHKKTPYYVTLLEDDNGNTAIKKSFREYKIGDKIAKEGRDAKEEIVGIIGTGSMGLGIAQLALLSGCKVILRSRTKKSLDKASEQLEKDLSKLMSPESKDVLMKKIKFTIDLNDLSDVDIIIESVVEDADVKKDLFRELDSVCPKKTVFATNTSSLSVDDLASVVSNPDRFAGMHFFKPASKMQLVEVIKGKKTSEKTAEFVKNLAEKFNKIPIVTKDSPCFIVNRILMPYLNEAVYALDEDVGTVEDIDIAAKLGLNHPMGPLELLDFIGIDVFLAIMENLYKRTQNPKYLACKLVEKMVMEGKLGRKTGQGFYKYE